MSNVHFGSVHLIRTHSFPYGTHTMGTSYGVRVASTEEDAKNGRKSDEVYVDLRSDVRFLSHPETYIVGDGNDKAAKLTEMVDKGIPDQEAFTNMLHAFIEEIPDNNWIDVMKTYLTPNKVEEAINSLKQSYLQLCTTLESASEESSAKPDFPSFEVMGDKHFPLTK